MRTLLPFVCGLLVLGCGDGGGGDAPPEVKGSVLGQGASLETLNGRPTRAEGDPERDVPAGLFSLDGLSVLQVDNFDEAKDGRTGNIYAQVFTQTPQPYQGILLFQSSFSPPTFRTSVGDVIDVTGQYTEFQINGIAPPGWTTPELSGNVRLRFDAPYVVIPPVEIPVTDLVAYEDGRKWLSMVVTVRDVKLINELAVDARGRASIPLGTGMELPTGKVPTITNEFFDLAAYIKKLKDDGTLTKLNGAVVDVTGIVTTFTQFHVAPRRPDDIVFKSVPPPEQQ